VGTLSAPAAGNGLVGLGSRFPRQVTRGNYWVDVLLRSESSGAARTASPSPAPSSVASGSAFGGWQLTGANTGLAGAGVDRTTLPVYSGPISSGMTLSMVKITSTVDVSDLTNVTLDRVWIAPTDGGDVLALGSNDVIKDSDLSGEFTPAGNAAVCGIRIFDATGYAIQRVHVTGVQIGAWIDGNGTGSLTDSYVQANRSLSGGHVDGLTRRRGSGTLSVARDRIEANVDGSTTGAFFLQTTDGVPIAGITVQDTLLEGIGYLMTLNNTGAGVSVAANNVRFHLTTANYYGDATMYGAGPTVITQWTNMYDYDRSKSNAAGRPVAKP